MNLNSLHLHLLTTFPAMLAPSFKCDKVTPSSLELHYHSHRPALWPLAAGIIKGVAHKIYKYDSASVQVSLISGRDMAESKNDHEVVGQGAGLEEETEVEEVKEKEVEKEEEREEDLEGAREGGED